MRLISLIFIILVIGCEVDPLPSCSGFGGYGQVCRVYKYILGNCQSVKEYEYHLSSGFLSTIVTKSNNGSLQGLERINYNDQNLISTVVLENSKGKLLTIKNSFYNDSGQIEIEIVSGKINTEKRYFYEGKLLKSVVFLVNGNINWKDSLKYLSNTNQLLQKVRFVKDTLEKITSYEEYYNNVKEEKVTNYSGVMQSRRVTKFDLNDNIKEEILYSPYGFTLKRTKYAYNNGLLERVITFDKSGTEYERLEYRRF